MKFNTKIQNGDNIQKKMDAQIKQSPELMENIMFLLPRLVYIKNPFKTLPKSILDNELFLYEYFCSVHVKEKDKAHIPKSFLDNDLFFIKAMKVNPDFFFFAPERVKNDLFAILSKEHPSEIVKYAQNRPEILDEQWVIDQIKKHATNYQYAPEKIRAKKDVYNIVCYNSNSSLFAYFPDEVLNDVYAVYGILNKAPSFFKDLPKKYLSNEDFVFSFLKKNTSMLSDIDKSLQNDHFYQKLLDHYLANKTTPYYLSDPAKNTAFKISHVLEILPSHFYTSTFIDTFSEDIANNFTTLSKSLRANHEVILAASEHEDFLRSEFLNKIEDQELKQQIKELKNNKMINSNNSKEMIASLLLKNKLEKTLENQPVKSVGSRLKI